MRNWDRLVDEYMEQYTARGVASETARNVRRQLDRLGCWLKNRRPRPKLAEVGSDLLIRYIRTRTAYKAKATVSGTMSVMRCLGEYLVRQGVWASNPLRWMRGPKLNASMRIPRRLASTDLKAVWEAAAQSRQGYHRYLWTALIALLYGTGVRRGELQRLNLSDWSAAESTLKIDGRKTGRERLVVVPQLSRSCLEAYLPQRQNHLEQMGVSSEQALFVDKNGGRLAIGAISHGFRRICRRCKLPRITLHQFRHSCASDLLQEGVHLAEVQRLLGHQTISTTVRYLHIADPQRHQAVALHPLNEILTTGGRA